MSRARIWKRLFGVPVIAMMFGALAVQAQSPQSSATTTTEGKQTASPSTGSTQATTTGTSGQAAGAQFVKSDQRLLIDLAQANLAEIEAARLAQDKTQNQEVKNFAQQMINDHTKALQEVQQLAQARGVTLPTEADAKHKRMAQRLSGLSGDAFDRRYLAQSGVADHKKTHALLERVQGRAKDAELKALAARLQPTVDQHLNSVQQLSATVAKGAGKTDSAGASGTQGTQGSGSTETKPNPYPGR